MIFNFFKKKKPKCKHYKDAGGKALSNMVQIYRFSPYKSDDTFGYGISQCAECGKRAFGCLFFHTMSDRQVKTIDKFINYEINAEQFEKFLKEEMAWFTVSAPPPQYPPETTA